LCDTPLLANEVSYSIPDRRSVENGVLDYCQQNDILLIAYTPIHRRNTSSNPVIGEIAAERGLSREQIALAWLISQPRVVTIPMSHNPAHQAANLAVADLTLTDDEMERLNQSIRR
jgi:diketogulonate reductase-like aldo/keto reductase